jgi:DNA processing protein
MKTERVLLKDLIGPLNTVEQKNAPHELFVAGDENLCVNFSKVSVIGTRQVSEMGIKRTRDLVNMLVKRDVVIVSGLALGVDSCAHEAAIKAGGKTIAVLGTPLDQFYPKENEKLQRKIMDEHLAISQFPVGSTVQKKNFPIRNRTMALISHATVIIEAGEGSGTLHQGWEALRLGRPLFLLESLTKQHDLKWPKEMMSYGAQVLTKDTIEVLFEFLPQGRVGAVAEMSF